MIVRDVEMDEGPGDSPGPLPNRNLPLRATVVSAGTLDAGSFC